MSEQKPSGKNKTARFRSRTGAPVQIALDSGHICYIQTEWTDVQQRFWTRAVASKCEMEGVPFLDEDFEPEEVGESEHEALKRVIREMMDEQKVGDFTAAGVPNMKALSKRVGKTVLAEEMRLAWREITEEQGLDESESE